jgi:hypothetical protein
VPHIDPDAAPPIDRFAPVPDDEPLSSARRGGEWWRRVGAFLSVVIVIAAIGVAAVGLGVAAHGVNEKPTLARERAARANREVLEAGEVVQAQLGAFERRWWNYFVPSYGVLTVTQRRVLIADVPPRPGLLGRRSDPPLQLTAMRYDSIRAARAQLVFAGTERGIVLEARGEPVVIGLDHSIDRRTVDSVATLIATHATRARNARACEARYQAILAAPPPMRPDSHLVLRGEALSILAARYNTTVEDLVRANHLPNERVRAGQTLYMRDVVDSAALRAKLPNCPPVPELSTP